MTLKVISILSLAFLNSITLFSQNFECTIKSVSECDGLDKVVAAQDLAEGLPGGMLEL